MITTYIILTITWMVYGIVRPMLLVTAVKNALVSFPDISENRYLFLYTIGFCMIDP